MIVVVASHYLIGGIPIYKKVLSVFGSKGILNDTAVEQVTIAKNKVEVPG